MFYFGGRSLIYERVLKTEIVIVWKRDTFLLSFWYIEVIDFILFSIWKLYQVSKLYSHYFQYPYRRCHYFDTLIYLFLVINITLLEKSGQFKTHIFVPEWGSFETIKIKSLFAYFCLFWQFMKNKYKFNKGLDQSEFDITLDLDFPTIFRLEEVSYCIEHKFSISLRTQLQC